jgi:hypothetical protein
MWKVYRSGLVIGVVLILWLVSTPGRVYAQWPPFNFWLTPSYENGKIKYNISFSSKVERTLGDVTIKIPLPEGTRFLEAQAQPTTSATFDGIEVTFFTSAFHRPIKDASFVVEITDPARTIFTAHAWIAWQGELAGDYLTQDVSIDITRRPLNWDSPPGSRLQLGANAFAANGIITYNISPMNIGGMRMWDLKINIPIPEGTSFLSAEAPAPFVTSFDGREVSFFTTEMAQRVEVNRLSFKVSTTQVTTPFVVTHAWATWKNVGRSVGRSVVFQEETRSGDLIVQPNSGQWVVSDRIGDTPFTNYDLISIALQDDGSSLKITFYTAGELGAVGEPFLYYLYIDKDCRADTGLQRSGLGRDYQIIYRHDRDRANFNMWDEEQKKWRTVQGVKYQTQANAKMVAIWVPGELLENRQQFCWQAESRYVTNAFSQNPPTDATTLARYETVAPGSTPLTDVAAAESLYPIFGVEDDITVSVEETNSFNPIPSTTDIGGKLAIPLDNGRTSYNVHIFSMPDGQEIVRIPNARQPNFRFDGQRILINREGGGLENLYEYNFADGLEQVVSDAPRDSHPFYDSGGNKVVYGNAELLNGNGRGPRQPFIFVQCSLLPPHLELDGRCRDIAGQRVLIPAGQIGEIQGSHPVWTLTDMIVYRGCNTWAGSRLCGIYNVPSASNRASSDGFIPRQLTDHTTDTPTDTKGYVITFMSQRDGNWEVYVMGLDGANVKNLSNSPSSNDGLATISPDGQWVAFVSDRDGRWAVWVTPLAQSAPQKLFDLPGNVPWGDGDRSWSNERISWGP